MDIPEVVAVLIQWISEPFFACGKWTIEGVEKCEYSVKSFGVRYGVKDSMWTMPIVEVTYYFL